MVIVFGLLVAAVVLFVSERVSFDTVALLIMGALLATGVLTVREGLSGLSNRATVTIGAMFVVSEGVRRTAALNVVSNLLSRLGEQNFWLAVGAMMATVAVCSALINNTAAVAILLPVAVGLAGDLDLDVVAVFRESGDRSADGRQTVLRAGDTVRVRGSAVDIGRLLDMEGVVLRPREEWHDVDLEVGGGALVEAVVAPESQLIGRRVRDVEFYERFGAVLLAIRSGGEL